MKKNLVAMIFLACFISFGLKSSNPSLKIANSQSFGNAQIYAESECYMSPSLFQTVLLISLASKIGYDVSWQSSYSRFSSEFYCKLNNYIEIYNIQSLADANLYRFFTRQDLESLAIYENWIKESYNSWLKPWNWNAEQKSSCQKIQLISMIALYGPMIALGANLKDQDMIMHAQKYCSVVSAYPLVYYGILIDEHLAFLSKELCFEAPKVMNNFLLELKESLYTLRFMLHSNRDYLDEFYNFRSHQLLEQIKYSRLRKK